MDIPIGQVRKLNVWQGDLPKKSHTVRSNLAIRPALMVWQADANVDKIKDLSSFLPFLHLPWGQLHVLILRHNQSPHVGGDLGFHLRDLGQASGKRGEVHSHRRGTVGQG